MASSAAGTFGRSWLIVAALALALAHRAAFAEENPNVPKAAAGEPIDLLKKVDLTEDAVAGTWTRTEAGIQSDDHRAKLRLYYKPEGEYDFRISFARLSGKGGIAQALHYGNANFVWGMGTHGNTVFGFGNLDGHRLDQNETTTKKALTNGKKYTAVVRVRDGSVSAFVDDELVSHLVTDYSNLKTNGFWDVGTDRLGISSESPFLIYSAELIPVTAKVVSKPDAKNDKFVARMQSAIDAARTEMLRLIDNVAKDVQQSSLDPDEKRLLLNKIGKDRDAFDRSQKLPSSDELLGTVVAFLEYWQKNVAKIENVRKNRGDKEIRKAKGDSLYDGETDGERGLFKLIDGREAFASDTDWKGSRQLSKGALTLRLHVSEIAGNVFRGQLHQPEGRGEAVMKVEGKLTGNKIQFETTEMSRGKNRHLTFDGYLLSDRIVAGVGGITRDNTPASGYISLWKQPRKK